MKDFDSILQDISSPDEEIRHQAVIELIKTNDIRAIPALRDIARDDDSVKIRYYAKKGLHFLKNQTLPKAMTGAKPLAAEAGVTPGGGIHDDLENAFTKDDDDEKIAIIQRAIKLNASSTLPVLCRYLEGENNPFVKSKLIIAIGILGNESMVEILKPFLRDSDYRIKANTIEALGYIGTRSVYPLILEALDDPDNRVRANAIRIINKFGKTKVRQLIESMIRSGDVAMMGSAIMVISEIARGDLLPLLEEAWSRGDATVRARVEKTLGSMAQKEPEANNILARINSGKVPSSASGQDLLEHLSSRVAQLLADPDSETRLKGVWESVECEDPTISLILEELVTTDPEPRVRAATVNALGKIGNPSSIPVLINCLMDKDSRTRANAVEVLGRYGDPEVGQAVLPLLRDENNRVRGNAIITVARLDAGDYLPNLKEMAASRDPMLRRTAIFVIMDLDGPAGAVELLDKLARDKDPEVKAKALETLSILTDSGNEKASSILSSIGGEKAEKAILEQHRQEGLTVDQPGQDGLGDGMEDLVSDIDIERMIFDLSSEVENTRKNAARILESIGNEKCLEPLQEALKDSSNSVRYYAGKAINAIKRKVDFNRRVADMRGDGGKSMSAQELGRLLEDPSRDIRISAIQQVKITDSYLLDLLAAHLQKETDDFVKPALASTIGMLGDEAVVPLLVPLLREKDPRVRANTIEALEYTCSPEVLHHIIPFLQDENNRVKANAIKAVQNAGKDNALRHLAEMCRSEQVWYRESAAFALGAMKDSRAVEMLIDLIVTEKTGSVCNRAARSLVNLVKAEHVPLLVEAARKVQDPRKTKLFAAVASTLKGQKPDMDSITGIHGASSEETVTSTARPQAAPVEPTPAPAPAPAAEAPVATAPAATVPAAPATAATAPPVMESAPEVRTPIAEELTDQEEGSERAVKAPVSEAPKPEQTARTILRKDPFASSQGQEQESQAADDSDAGKKEAPKKKPGLLGRAGRQKPQEVAEEKAVEATRDKPEASEAGLSKVEKMIAKLARELKNPDDELRKKAVLELTRIGGKEVLPYLEKAATDGDTVVRFFAKKGITSIQKNMRNQAEHGGSQASGSKSSGGLSKLSNLSPGLKKLAGVAVVILLIGAVVALLPLDRLFSNDKDLTQPDPEPVTQTRPADQDKPKPAVKASGSKKLSKVDLTRWYTINRDPSSDSLKWGNMHGRKMNYSKAAESFKKLMENSQDSIEVNLKYLYSMKRDGQGRMAMSHYHSQTSSSPGPLPLYMEALAAPSNSMAQRKLEEIVASNPDFAFARLSLASIMEDTGKTEEALHLYTDYRTQAGDEPKTIFALTRCLYALDRIQEAEAMMANLPALNQKDVEAVILRSRILVKQGKTNEAITILEAKASEIFLEPRIQFNLGFALFTAGRFKDAAQAFERVTKVSPTNKDAYYFLSLVYDKLGDEHASIKAAVKASKVDPECKTLYNFQAGGKFAQEAIPEFVEREDENFDADLTGPGLPLDFFRMGLKDR